MEWTCGRVGPSIALARSRNLSIGCLIFNYTENRNVVVHFNVAEWSKLESILDDYLPILERVADEPNQLEALKSPGVPCDLKKDDCDSDDSSLSDSESFCDSEAEFAENSFSEEPVESNEPEFLKKPVIKSKESCLFPERSKTTIKFGRRKGTISTYYKELERF
eukprot:GHVP01026684.1.p1 GENE.GHVP01026684.1~~GHVP01026684.1.p1  ORF type:complete len:164 (-),score=37.67 GHVP01026684.1:154-645(-)